MAENPSRLREQAAKARQISGQTRDRDIRQMLIILAERYEAAAEELEQSCVSRVKGLGRSDKP